MFRVFCNQLCIRIRQRLRPLAIWLAAFCGLPLLPTGFSMFSNELAKQVGADRAAVHQKLKGWQEHNQRYNKRSHFRQGQWWTFGKPEYWHENEFVWLSLSTVKRALKDLEKAGFLLIDQSSGPMWLCATSGEPVKLDSRESNLQLALPILDSATSNWPSSIGESTKHSFAKGKRQSSSRARAGVRKDAVADFNLPNPQDKAAFETHEHRDTDTDGDGQDVLHELPGQLVSGWRDKSLKLDEFIEQYGVKAIRDAWAQAEGFEHRIAGTRYLLGQAPTPSSAPPPTPTYAKNAQAAPVYQDGDHPLFKLLAGPDDDTEPDGELEEVSGNETPAIDVPVDPNKQWWDIAYSQLEIQLDRATFETWLRGAVFLGCADDGTYRIGVANTYARDMLQHRLYREIRRVLGDVLGTKVELRFEVMEAAHVRRY